MQELEIIDGKRMKEVKEAIREMASIYQERRHFWRNASGWAPKEAANILSKSRLDWLHSLSEALFIWTETYRTPIDNDGKLILAWTNLGSLLEGGLKLFLSVYYLDYKKSDIYTKNKNNKIKDPDELSMEKLKVFIQKEKIFDKDWIEFISLVQARRNAIHAYKNREIGDWEEFFTCVEKLRDFTNVIENRLPYPH